MAVNVKMPSQQLLLLLLLFLGSSHVEAQGNTIDTLLTISAFGKERDTVGISELVATGTTVAHVTTSLTNEDSFCLMADDGNHFRLEQLTVTAYIITTLPLDREEMLEPWYDVYVLCSDKANPPRRATKKLRIYVIDANDNAPVFSEDSYEIVIAEDTPVGTEIKHVLADDPDGKDFGNGEVFYQILGDARYMLSIDENSGVISTAVQFDYEEMKNLSFYVIAVDRGSPQKSSRVPVTLVITNVNDEPPVLTQDTYYFIFNLEQSAGAEVGVVAATDADGPDDEFLFYFNHTTDTFEVDSVSGVITSTVEITGETDLLYHLTVDVMDKKEMDNWHPEVQDQAEVFVIVLTDA